jgi:hypothetical protein
VNQDEMIEKIFEHASASEAGDYYQVCFDDNDDPESIDGRYLLIQRQFEFPDDDSYYLESGFGLKARAPLMVLLGRLKHALCFSTDQ